jgi:hypothetical protein
MPGAKVENRPMTKEINEWKNYQNVRWIRSEVTMVLLCYSSHPLRFCYENIYFGVAHVKLFLNFVALGCHAV